jgi:hypothetical protein
VDVKEIQSTVTEVAQKKEKVAEGFPARCFLNLAITFGNGDFHKLFLYDCTG